MKEIKHIGIGADHAGYAYKQAIIAHLQGKGIQVQDFGTDSEASCDYPDYAHPLAEAITTGRFEFGILICGSGNGVCMAANKHFGIRAAMAWGKPLAELARQHNDANVLCLPSRFVSPELALELVDAFLSTEFEGGRHARRVNKIGFANVEKE